MSGQKQIWLKMECVFNYKGKNVLGYYNQFVTDEDIENVTDETVKDFEYDWEKISKEDISNIFLDNGEILDMDDVVRVSVLSETPFIDYHL